MQVNPNESVGQLAATHPKAIAYFERHGIDYCCHGKQTLADACAAKGLPVDDAIASLISAGAAPAVRDWSRETLSALMKHIVDTHHVYTRDELEVLMVLGDKVANRHGRNHAEVVRLFELIGAMKNDLLPHMLKEEQVLFPYIEKLEEARIAGTTPPVPFFATVRNPVRMMLSEHDAVGDLLAEARKVTSGYALPEDACFSFQQLYQRLEAFEADVHQHIHLENNVLFDRAVALEGDAEAGFAMEAKPNCCGSHH